MLEQEANHTSTPTRTGPQSWSAHELAISCLPASLLPASQQNGCLLAAETRKAVAGNSHAPEALIVEGGAGSGHQQEWLEALQR